MSITTILAVSIVVGTAISLIIDRLASREWFWDFTIRRWKQKRS